MVNQNVSLKQMNTFGIDAHAKLFARIQDVSHLECILEQHSEESIFILGGGSNILFTNNFEGLILKNEIKGFKIIEETDDFAIVESGAGENWHEFVMKCIEQNLGGIENLSLIPGNVGARPMQNIGAYGVEIKDVFEYLDAFHLKEKEMHRFNADECKFGYRESIFKNSLKGQYVICNVAFRLSKKPVLNTSYGAIEKELQEMQISKPTIKDVSNAVIKIRQSKLPDPNEIGNAGSFFKNPVVPIDILSNIQKKYPDVPHYSAPNDKVKLAAGWLIEKAGWKGRTFENRYGVHKHQALVLVNYNQSKGEEILQLSNQIIHDVEDKFNITLNREVNIL